MSRTARQNERYKRTYYIYSIWHNYCCCCILLLRIIASVAAICCFCFWSYLQDFSILGCESTAIRLMILSMIIDWSMVLNSWLRDRSTDTLDDYRNIISMSGHSVVNWLSIRQGFWIPSSDIFISTSIPYTTIITYFWRVVTRWSSDYRLVKGFEFLVTIPFYIYLAWIS